MRRDNLLRMLWRWWGSKEHPAEWDGNVYGGGKVSQRFWEYFWAVNQIEEEWNHVADIGSGTTQFLPNLLRNSFAVVSVDPAIQTNGSDFGMNLSAFVKHIDHDIIDFDCVFAISVMEHVPPNQRTNFITDLDKFENAIVIITLELGPQNNVWPPVQVEELKFFSEMKKHYLTKMEACPIWCPNSSPTLWRPVGFVFSPFPKEKL